MKKEGIGKKSKRKKKTDLPMPGVSLFKCHCPQVNVTTELDDSGGSRTRGKKRGRWKVSRKAVEAVYPPIFKDREEQLEAEIDERMAHG